MHLYQRFKLSNKTASANSEFRATGPDSTQQRLQNNNNIKRLWDGGVGEREEESEWESGEEDDVGNDGGVGCWEQGSAPARGSCDNRRCLFRHGLSLFVLERVSAKIRLSMF